MRGQGQSRQIGDSIGEEEAGLRNAGGEAEEFLGDRAADGKGPAETLAM